MKIFAAVCVGAVVVCFFCAVDFARAGASLVTAKGVPAYLYADAKARTFMGMNPSAGASGFVLKTPLGEPKIDKLSFGRAEVIGSNPVRINVKAVELSGEMTFASSVGDAKVTVNGKDVTDKCLRSGKGSTQKLTYKFPGDKSDR